MIPREPGCEPARTEFVQRPTRALTTSWSSQHGRTRHSRIARCARTLRSALDARRPPEARCAQATRCARESRCARNSRDPLHSHDTWKARMPLSSFHPTTRVNVVRTLLGRMRPELFVNHILEPQRQGSPRSLARQGLLEKCRRYVSKYVACSCRGYCRRVDGYRLCAREASRASAETPLGFR